MRAACNAVAAPSPSLPRAGRAWLRGAVSGGSIVDAGQPGSVNIALTVAVTVAWSLPYSSLFEIWRGHGDRAAEIKHVQELRTGVR
jgi:hypothetical protein